MKKSQKTESKFVRYGMWRRPSCVQFALCGVLVSFLLAIQLAQPVTAISIANDDEIANEFAAASDNLNFNSDPAGEFVFSSRV